jgi:hypothetical protein
MKPRRHGAGGEGGLSRPEQSEVPTEHTKPTKGNIRHSGVTPIQLIGCKAPFAIMECGARRRL